MKIYAWIFVLCVVGTVQCNFFEDLLDNLDDLLENLDLDDVWQNFKERQQRRFVSGVKERVRKNAFLQRVKDVAEHNSRLKKGLETFKRVVNKFADYPREEFVATHCGANVSLHVENASARVFIHPRQTIPTSWDIRRNGPGLLRPAKDQGDCGSCWAFSTTGSIENAATIRWGNQYLYDLSEQQQVDCTYGRDGCDGGWFASAYDYVIKTGLLQQAQIGYQERYLGCRTPSTQTGTVKISGYRNLANDATTIKSWLMQRGACAICVDATYWSSYGGGVYSDTRARTCNHAVVLIGWGYDSTARKQFWLIRNSWGRDWGEDGHIKVAADGTGGVFTQYVYCPYI